MIINKKGVVYLIDISLRTIIEDDLQPFWNIAYGPEANLSWKEYDDPFFDNPTFTWDEFKNGYGKDLMDNENRNLIMVNEDIVGLVTAYWTDGGKLREGPKQWLEVGIVIFNPNYWGLGIGSKALTMWLKELFGRYDYLAHIGFTTWSGNLGMQKIGEKTGMTKEGVIRQVRFLDGTYYDAVKYGILRNEMK